MRERLLTYELGIDGSLPSQAPPVPTFVGSGTSPGVALATLQSSSVGSSRLSFEWAIKMATAVAAISSTAAFCANPSLAGELMRQSITIATPEHGLTSPTAPAASRTAALRSIETIDRELDAVPIEDGTSHPAERCLAVHVDTFGEAGLLDAVQANHTHVHQAQWLRLLGRTSVLGPLLRANLVRWGLASPSVEVRDAAMQAVENWEDRALVKMLREHYEPIAWLSRYAANIVNDIET